MLNYFRGDPREVRESVEDPLRPVVYVEGARVVSPPDSLQLNGSNINEYKSIETARKGHTDRRNNSLRTRVEHAFLILKVIGKDAKLRGLPGLLDILMPNPYI